MTKPVIGYWNLQGLLSQVVYMFEYCGVEYDLKLYNLKGEAPNIDMSEWTDVKFTMDTNFPNLPYLQDGEFLLTETTAVQKYVAAKWKPSLLQYDNVEAFGRNEQLGNVVNDVQRGFAATCYTGDDTFEEFVASGIAKFEVIAKHLNGKKWLAGDELIWVDFTLGATLDLADTVMKGALLEAYPVLKEYHARFFALPSIKEFNESDRTLKNKPLTSPLARYGG